MPLFERYPTDRMPNTHAEREAQARLKMHLHMSRIRLAVRVFLASDFSESVSADYHDAWGRRLLEEMVCLGRTPRIQHN